MLLMKMPDETAQRCPGVSFTIQVNGLSAKAW